jgi:nucleoside phosphorylase
MDILIVEDGNAERVQLVQSVRSVFGEGANITDVDCASLARRYLRKNAVDLLITDVCIPNSTNDDPSTAYGFELIAEATWSDDYIRPRFLIVVSSLEEVSGKREDEGKEGVFYWVYRDPLDGTWLSRLLAKLRYVQSVSETAPQESFDIDVALLCALEDKELDAVKDNGWKWAEDEARSRAVGSRVFSASVPSAEGGGGAINVICTSAPQMGMPAMAVLTSKVIAAFKPRFVVMAGVAGAVKGQGATRPDWGDPLIAEMSWDFGSGKLSTDASGMPLLAPDLRPISVYESMRPLISKIRHDKDYLRSIRDGWKGEKPASDLVVHVGPVGSGAAVLAAASLVQEIIKQQRKMIGFEMEIYGMYYACVNHASPRPLGYLAVKSVMDYGHSEKDDKYKTYAAYTSALVVKKIVECHLLPLCVQ